VKVAVLNEHWSTLGGGEQLAAGFAHALGTEHEVDLLVREPFDAARASERLGLDLTLVRQREVPWITRSLMEVSEEYDLLVNSSFASQTPSRAARSLYYVHFPIPFDERSRVAHFVQEHLGPYCGRGRGQVEWADGWYFREFPGEGRWTKGDARLDLFVPDGATATVGLTLTAKHWPARREPRARVTVEGRVVFDGVLRSDVRVRTTVTGRGAEPLEARIESETFVPRIEQGIDDDRVLGVVVSRPYIDRPLVHVPGRLRPEFLERGRFFPDFLTTYDVVAANSAYTREWVERLWGRPAVVLAPPVPPRRTEAKAPIVLSVGRFFSNDSGHSKKQLELTRAFRRLVEDHGVRGWDLHLVGGCVNEHRGYVDAIRREAVGLPVRLDVNASGELVESLFARASIYWHGAGLGEDPDLHPDRFEHFGISVVEAMSAGAVPVVFSRGGPASTVEPGLSGLHFSSVPGLASATATLIQDPERLDRLAAGARSRAAEFAPARFDERVRTLVNDLVRGVAGRRGSAART
jgi:glycosyltransferase involved in cell wall biosynthesis